MIRRRAWSKGVSPQQAGTLRVTLAKRLVHLQVLVEDAAGP